MTRDARLRFLSEGHERALLLARSLLLASRGHEPQVRSAWNELQRAFDAELGPHFLLEETLIVPALVEIGEIALAGKVVADHTRIRHLLREPGADLSTSLIRIAGELIAHIRFEEAEVYERAQEKLPVALLEQLRAAHPRPIS